MQWEAGQSKLSSYPKGYDTPVAELGASLSGGQKQRIAVARAALADLMKGCTSFVVAHRLSTIRNADQVLVVMDGEIVERGTHQQLLARRSKYYDLYTSNTLGRQVDTPEVSGNGRHGLEAAVPAAV